MTTTTKIDVTKLRLMNGAPVVEITAMPDDTFIVLARWGHGYVTWRGFRSSRDEFALNCESGNYFTSAKTDNLKRAVADYYKRIGGAVT